MPDDRHVILLEVINVGALHRAGQKLDAHRNKLLVDLGVVNDLAENVDRWSGKTLRAAYARSIARSTP